MLKNLFVFLLALSLIGCATPRVQQTQMQELQNRVVSLEKELRTKDEQIRSLEEELYRKEVRIRGKTEEKGFLSISPKRIQAALKNVGFYKGPIDGNIGPQTRQAIKEFQKANGLKADGIIGKRTWEKLSKHLN